MKPIITCSTLAALIALGGCQTVKLASSDSGELSEAYLNCVYDGYNAAVSANSLPLEEAIDQAIKGCGDEAHAYAEAIARNLGIPSRSRYNVVVNTFKPNLEKETREQFIARITDVGTAK
tara:strand:+ start:291 stop:650 length:360 start_codon:yes stop_codon:yes gene_type:complete